MSSDPFDLLRQLGPEAEDRPLQPGEDPAAERMLRSILETPQDSTVVSITAAVRGRRTRLVLLSVAATVGLGVSSAAAANWWIDRAANPAELACYSEANTDPVARLQLPLDPTTTPENQCSAPWFDGTFDDQGPPLLVACAADFGATVVIPGTPETCNEIGLAAASSSRLDGSLDARVAAAVPGLFMECGDDLDAAAEQVMALLETMNAEHWTVRVEGAVSPARPCATNVIDAERREVLIIAG